MVCAIDQSPPVVARVNLGLTALTGCGFHLPLPPSCQLRTTSEYCFGAAGLRRGTSYAMTRRAQLTLPLIVVLIRWPNAPPGSYADGENSSAGLPIPNLGQHCTVRVRQCIILLVWRDLLSVDRDDWATNRLAVATTRRRIGEQRFTARRQRDIPEHRGLGSALRRSEGDVIQVVLCSTRDWELGAKRHACLLRFCHQSLPNTPVHSNHRRQSVAALLCGAPATIGSSARTSEVILLVGECVDECIRVEKLTLSGVSA